MNTRTLQLERMAEVLDLVQAEAISASQAYPPFASCHEGYAVLLEEVDELWEHVKVKQGQRDVEAMLTEAIQVAAMAVRFAADLCNEKAGQK